MKFGWQVVRASSGRREAGQSPLSWRFLLPLVLVGAVSCVSTEMRDAQNSGRVTQSSAAPLWVGQPLGWSKLEQIERWLQSDANRYDSTWRLQAELTLGEGRLVYARREAPASDPSNAWLARLRSSQAGFERVLADPLRNRSQEQRARLGLEEVESLRSLARRSTPAVQDSTRLARYQWNARSPIPARLDPARGTFNRITIHHTAEVPGTRFDGTLSDSLDVLRTVQRVHMDNRNYGDIGYHFLVDSQGRVFEGRSLKYQGAHAGGANNKRNIGICLIGNFKARAPSSPAMNALEGLLTELRAEHGIARGGIIGHGELKATECPGPTLARWTRNYRSQGPRMSQLGNARKNMPVAQASRAATRPVRATARSSAWSSQGRRSVVR